MAPTHPRTSAALAALALLVIGIVILLIMPAVVSTGRGRLRLPAGDRPPAISLGERHGLVLAPDGSLWSWGSDFLGRPVLGLGNLTNKSTTLRRVGRDTNWVGISAGNGHNLALKSDGTLWTWGGTIRARGAPWFRPLGASTPVLAAESHDWKQAAAGGVHSVAIKKDGTLWAWGDNWAGSVGIESTNGSSVPVQVGSATNWVKVWAASLETVGMQSDGSLWYWGDNPNPAFDMDVGRIVVPTRITPDTNWVDVGFGVNTVFAIKWDGTLWTWGRGAHVYTGATDPAQNAVPTRIGPFSDWRAISPSSRWWCQGLVKNDGSLWLMDASDGEPNGPRPPYKPVRFRRIDFQKDYVAFAAGGLHGTAPGVHGPITVLLTRDGEVWTSGMVLGDPPTLQSRAETVMATVARAFNAQINPPPPPAVFRDKPWQLLND